MSGQHFTDSDLARLMTKQGLKVDFKVPKPRKKRDNEESRIQCALIKWWAVAHKKFGVPEFLLYSVPNGGWRNKITGATMKREGARSGATDLVLDVARGKYHGLRIEMKKPTGVVSDEQKEFISALKAQGYMAGAAFSLTDAIRFIEAYMGGDEFLM